VKNRSGDDEGPVTFALGSEVFRIVECSGVMDTREAGSLDGGSIQSWETLGSLDTCTRKVGSMYTRAAGSLGGGKSSRGFGEA
jgi:hypothetical protein